MRFVTSFLGVIGVILIVYVMTTPGSQGLLAALAGVLTTLGFWGLGSKN